MYVTLFPTGKKEVDECPASLSLIKFGQIASLVVRGRAAAKRLSTSLKTTDNKKKHC